jgi:oligogalacturonide lyase
VFWPRLARWCGAALLAASPAAGQIGRRFPSEKRIVPDPVTGVLLSFLTSTPGGDSKIYPTHRQWTSDGQWLVFRSNRVRGQALAVHEATGAIVQVTEHGYQGMLCLAHRSMKLYVMRDAARAAVEAEGISPPKQEGAGRGGSRGRGPVQIVEVDLGKLLPDSAAGTLQPAAAYERVCGTVPANMVAGADLALDASDAVAYFRFTSPELASRLPPGTKPAAAFGPRGLGAGPAGLAAMNLQTGETTFIAAVPFQIGHVQTNPWVPGEIVFCWETGGKAPQRTWTIRADGSGLRPLYPEADFEWVTHEAVITKDEVALAIMGHVPVSDQPGPWGMAGMRSHPTGLGIVNLRTREMRIAGQTPAGSGLWHVHGSADGRWAVGDDFSRSLFLIDRQSGEMQLLTTGHKRTAADHPHPTFSPDGTRIQIQSALLSADDRSMNLCIVPVPPAWLARSGGTPAKR